MTVKKLYLASVFTVVFALTLTLFFVSCTNDSQNVEEVAKLEFLDLKIVKMSKMSEKDLIILGQAIHRLEISRSNGLYVIKETSGSQVNISEQLFDYIKQSFANTDKYFKNKKIKNLTSRLLSGDPETDCVARSISNMGSSSSYSEINQYIIDMYGSEGVPLQYIGSVVQRFCPDATFSTTPPASSGGLSNALILINDGSSYWHAVNGQYYDSSSQTVMYTDHQYGQDGLSNINNVRGYFYCN